MCLAIPSRIVELDEFSATVDVYGAQRNVSLLLMPEEVTLDDYVLVHAGFAIQKVDRESALESLAFLKETLSQENLDGEVTWDARADAQEESGG